MDPDDTGPYPPDPALGNTGLNPLAGARWSPSLGGLPLSKHMLNNLLHNVREQDGPFYAGVAPSGLSCPLSQEEADYLNQRFGLTP